jgi:hypothetical protein
MCLNGTSGKAQNYITLIRNASPKKKKLRMVVDCSPQDVLGGRRCFGLIDARGLWLRQSCISARRTLRPAIEETIEALVGAWRAAAGISAARSGCAGPGSRRRRRMLRPGRRYSVSG